MKVSIIGLPQSGKTTLFNAIAGMHGQTLGHGADEILRAVVNVPDERLYILGRMVGVSRNVPATLELEDVGPLFEERHGTSVVRPSAIAAVREADGLIFVLRLFENEAVPPVGGRMDPLADAYQLRDELVLADLAIIEKKLDSLRKAAKKPTDHQVADKREFEILSQCRDALEKEQDLVSVSLTQEQLKLIRSYALLSLKPVLCAINTNEGQAPDEKLVEELGKRFQGVACISAQIEKEIMELAPEDRDEFLKDAGIQEPASGRIVHECYKALDLCCFFTAGARNDGRAWTIKCGDNALTAAGKVHTDMAKGFIRVEVVSYDDFIECGSMKEAKKQGRVRVEGREYIVQDGDIVLFRFNV